MSDRPATTIPSRLSGRHALITGASRGIGSAVAVRYATEGAVVAINYSGSEGAAKETLDRARDASGKAGFTEAASRHRIIQADVGDERAALAMVDDVLTDWGRLDILVNNAGIQSEAESHAYTIAEFRRILNVNLTGALVCSQAAIRHFLSRPGGGTIVNCSSVHQMIPKPGFIAYSISKGGLGNMTRTLALEYADKGIRVNAVAPGAILTDINNAWRNDDDAREGVESHIPMGRAGDPAEIASVFAFLASDDASYITGQTIYACGGLTLFGDFKSNWAS
ncbi:glucose-1-dehydrogenase [Skermanella stibiiresistens SB22]|uniref:Glucose-1-dehydrogenase n=1 Tax=Skermanella stibiiresistens SB22 TaxID=1385369 RepID=W9HBU1_9PROT|nr:glucose 1-dehydrogenase [Skermanella stibiiresistens]EWY42186.1 glucose-1-dehydrogenase [Skermanella stibiiresistens SB22]